MKNLLIVYGTRPEEIKLYPVWKELNCKALRVKQHTDLNQEMIEPDQTVSETEMIKAIKEADQDYIMVQGDTRTAFRGAFYGYNEGKKIIHLEAGLRSWNLNAPHPEEGYRRMIDEISTYHLFPTINNALNVFYPEELERAKINPVVGQTAIDTLDKFAPETKKTNKILVTIHRHPKPKQAIKALKKLKKDNDGFDFRIYAHPNKVGQALAKELKTKEQLPYKEFVKELAECYMVITDSGGLQEEAPHLDKPVVVWRNNTERQEGIGAGCSVLAGTKYEEMVNVTNHIIQNEQVYDYMANANNPYGDGKSSKRIKSILKEVLK